MGQGSRRMIMNDCSNRGTGSGTVTPEEVGVNSSKLAAVTRFIEAELAGGTFPGAALVCTRHGRVFLERYWGTYCSRTRADEPLIGGETHMCYSFSKGIAASAFAIAVSEGLLDYDRPVCNDIPEFGQNGKERITPRLLLCHTAGIPSAPLSTMYDDATWSKAVDAICQMAPQWEPGSKTVYHAASGALIVAEIVRRNSGLRFSDYCRRKVFEPLDTQTMGYAVPTDDVRLALTPPPKSLPCKVTPETYGAIGRPGGGAFATIDDMLKIIHLNLAGGIWRGQRLIAADAFKAMHTIQYEQEMRDDYEAGKPPRYVSFGMGWSLCGPAVDHNSLWVGFGNTTYGSFGHAGIDTIIGIGDIGRDLGIVFLTTDRPNPSEDNTRRVRTAVTNHVIAAFPPAPDKS